MLLNFRHFQIRDVQKKFVKYQDNPDLASLVKEGRSFIREGTLLKVCRRNDKKFQFWLFSDLLMYGHAVGGGLFKHHRTIHLHECEVEEIRSRGQGSGSGSGSAGGAAGEGKGSDDAAADPNANTFNVKSKHKSFVVRTPGSGAESVQQKNMWFADMQNSITATKEAHGVAQGDSVLAATWTQDSLSKSCPLCLAGFTFRKRKHHCRACGTLCCATCSSGRLMLPHLDSKKEVRVCDPCLAENEAKEDVIVITG